MNKRGAIELSMSTVVIIVLAMSMLILGLVLVKNIFTGATDSVSEINDKVKNAVSSLFVNEQADVVVYLGSDQTAKIKAGTDNFGVVIGAKTPDGSPADRKRLQYKLTLESSDNNCASPNYLGTRGTEALFKTSLNEYRYFDKYDGSNSFALIELTIPKGTATCTQKILIDVRDTKDNKDFGGTYFVMQVLDGGFFNLFG